ncbi:MAG: phage holin family protein [Bacteroidetes bacterium]|nr:phage holin family protein [Bacteroidota bacterium]HET6244737.1 phage holin family protein [Bacteroidia bacterium]
MLFPLQLSLAGEFFIEAMEDIKPKLDTLVDHIRAYINNRIEIARLMAIEKGALVISNVVSTFVLGLLFLFFIIFISITIAFVLSLLIGINYIGFLIVSVIYLLAALLLLWRRDKWMIEPISNVFIRSVMQDNNKKHD